MVFERLARDGKQPATSVPIAPVTNLLRVSSMAMLDAVKLPMLSQADRNAPLHLPGHQDLGEVQLLASTMDLITG